MASTLREIRDLIVLIGGQPRVLAVFTVIAALFVMTGPFGTYETLEAGPRAVYWITTFVAANIIAVSMMAIFEALFGDKDKVLSWAGFVGAGFASVPIAFTNSLIAEAAFGSDSAPGFFQMLGYALPIVIAFVVVGYLVVGKTNDRMDRDDPTGDRVDNVVTQRLPHDVRGPIKHMTMEDHYIRVTTVRGEAMVLMRMADAIAALPPGAGLRIRRSHWVAPAHVTDVKRVDGQTIVQMDDGASYPISRTYRDAARAAGLT